VRGRPPEALSTAPPADAPPLVSEVRAELRPHVLRLNALRQTQLEQGREISELRHEMRDGLARAGAVAVAPGGTWCTRRL